ncbi:MAG TPA: endopeptidase La [Anaerolineales bacterium]|nr:endopeptidase La [Anaerolineales bacterium]
MSDQDWFSQVEGALDTEELQARAEELEQILDIAPGEDGYLYLPVLPLREVIVFPHMVVPLPVGRESTIEAIEAANQGLQFMVALPQKNPRKQSVRQKDFLPVGVVVAVSEMFSSGLSENIIMVQGRYRVEIEAFTSDGDVLFAKSKVVKEHLRPNKQDVALMRNLMSLFERYAEITGNIPEEAMTYLMDIDQPGWLADMLVNSFSVQLQDRHTLLLNPDPTSRLEQVTDLLMKELGVLEIEEELHAKVQDEVERGQRENYLREQMRVIQRELGEQDPWARELQELHTRVKEAKLPEDAEKATLKEFDRLYQMPPMSPEVGVIRTYIDWMIELPWHTASEDNLDVKHATEVLDRYHYGLDKAKDRILEYIAVKSLKPKRSRQPILCFVGPPGTGKTSLGKSIAEALGRKFVRISLGGVRDEAEMRGHRRTYIGALPGRIIQTMKRAGTINPLFILDEVDKLGVGFRGDPAAALLEVLDPEQNHAFSDHYIEVPYDLSQVIFITTANYSSDIPWALLDRMEVVEFPGYIEDEKVEIAKKFLVHRQMDEAGLEKEELLFSENAIRRVINEYTYEAGVRSLEREIGRTCRKVARLKAEGKKFPSRINDTSLEKYLGPPDYSVSKKEEDDEVGVATGIAWTMGGGDIMGIEVALVEGKGNMQITGQIGDVMQESAQAAMTYLKSKAKMFRIDPQIFEDTDVHVHVPEGAIPKDGPSAGITLATAIISAFTRRKVNKDVGMTGEITLRGRVLAIGGVRNKVLAAHRSGLKTVILPAKNEKDLVDVPKKVKSDLNLIFVNHIDEVLAAALLPKEEKKKKAKKKAKEAKETAAPQAQKSNPEETSPPIQPGV